MCCYVAKWLNREKCEQHLISHTRERRGGWRGEVVSMQEGRGEIDGRRRCILERLLLLLPKTAVRSLTLQDQACVLCGSGGEVMHIYLLL